MFLNVNILGRILAEYKVYFLLDFSTKNILITFVVPVTYKLWKCYLIVIEKIKEFV